MAPRKPATQRATPLTYEVRAHNLHAHLYGVTLTVAQPAAEQVVSLPVWIPGSYLVREFARNLQNLTATQAGRDCTLTQQDKCSWQVACVPGKPLVLQYQVYAFDISVRTAWLDAQRGFFNGTSVCLRVHGQEGAAHQLKLVDSGLPANWQVATALRPSRTNRRGFGVYTAADYDELVDSPVELGAFWSGSFKAGGVPHRFVVAGAPASFDGARLLADAQTICAAEIAFWHDGTRTRAPHDRYVFMLNAVGDSYGGLEHRHSTALICKRADLPRLGHAKTLHASDGYTTLLGLISHEYFHTWNVKRLRPADFTRYNYTAENYTELLWFFEGFTSYYDDLLLRRAELIDSTTYLSLLGKNINTLAQTPGRQVQSVAQASFDAWVKYYRPDENTVNATVSYYTKGALVALCLDLSLRQAGTASLDDVMRALWQRCAGGPLTEADVFAMVTQLGGAALPRRLSTWVHGRDELPIRALLTHQGVAVQAKPASMADRLGLRVTESNGVRVKSVLRGSAAEAAGLAAGDEWLGLEVARGKTSETWRLNKLDDLPLYLGAAKKFQVWVARDQRMLKLAMALPPQSDQVELSVRDVSATDAWLAPKVQQKS